MFLIDQDALLIASPLATIIAALIGGGLGSLGSFYIHKSKLKHDKEQKEKDRETEAKIAALNYMKINNVTADELFNIMNDGAFEKTVDLLTNRLSESKENIQDTSINNNDKLDNDIIKSESGT
ncbi:hypothetical protein [Spiroplasma platyhelix]|uniref:Uncharacterized protein n=1 Tax=Spiroplasma platyhelix PALS-1 TaxID=1276218 RepID=A0A846UE91_9MOLU|nr:hypothetical protein [Spiroplasma platyhelix]MBE4704429.1 hypothetical protein [Spiroplasma platyhelix PALS-1]NKE38798.1 hypothetical protein [Spiroplasma platyhelix PALS-1]UJB29011.1 hypothetical protein SPLAT_v1c02470 [Spiroplasma platyhelix PALS-1]